VVDRDALSARLAALEEYLGELRAYRQTPRDEFVRLGKLHHHAERLLHLACECVLDIAHHVIAEEGLRQPSSYKDAIEVLREAGHIDGALAERLKDWMGFRNVLVHFYLQVDHGRAHEAIVEDIGDLEAFAARMARLLE
jgi:uncharacterized protein YutE (UPF0331/DUF86 family)